MREVVSLYKHGRTIQQPGDKKKDKHEIFCCKFAIFENESFTKSGGLSSGTTAEWKGMIFKPIRAYDQCGFMVAHMFHASK